MLITSSATLAMDEIKNRLSSAFDNLSDETYEESLSFYRLWFDIQHTYPEIPSDQTSDDIWNNRGSVKVKPEHGELFHPTAHLILRLARDAEGDCILGPHSISLQGRLCSRTLRNFFENNMKGVGCRDAFDARCWAAAYNGDPRTRPYWYQSELDKIEGINYHSAVDSNLIAHWANSGCATEAAIRNHILQSLVSHPKLYDHQADAIIILFKIAGATFEAYADPPVVNRCFELLKDHYNSDLKKAKLVLVGVFYATKDVQRADKNARSCLSYGSADGKAYLLHQFS